MSQCHLSPSSSSQQAASPSPIYWNCDHAMALLPLPDLVLVGLDAEYLEEGAHYGRAGCHVVAPISNPSRNEWQCAVAVLSTNGGGATTTTTTNTYTTTDNTNKNQQKNILVEFDNDDDEDEDEEDYQERDETEENDSDDADEDMEEAENDQDIYENYRVLGGTQNDTQLSQSTRLSA